MRLIGVGSLYVSNGFAFGDSSIGQQFSPTYKRLKFSHLWIKFNPNIDNTMELGKPLALFMPK